MGDVAAPPSHAGPVGEAAEDTTTTTTTAPAAEPADDYSPPAMTPMGDVGGPASDVATPTDDEWDGTVGPSSPSSQERNEAPDTMAPSNAPTQSTNNNRPGASENEDADDEPAYEGPAYTPMGDVGMPGPEASFAPELTEQGTVETNVDGPEDMTPRELGPREPDVHADARRRLRGPAGPGTANTTPARAVDRRLRRQRTAAFGLGGTVGFARDEDHTAITVGIAEGVGLFGSAGEEDAPETAVSAQSAVMARPRPDQRRRWRSARTPGSPGRSRSPTRSTRRSRRRTQYSVNLNHDTGFTTDSTEGMAFGAQEGAAVTHSVTISIPNDCDRDGRELVRLVRGA